MGKKTKKKGGTAAKRKTKQEPPKKPANLNKLDSDQTSLYKIYKYCTEAVIQWGKAAFVKKKKKGKNASNNKKSESLSHVIFGILGDLASDGVLMPELVLSDLTLAISYRKKVGRFYRSLPQVSDQDYARHEWLIQQLEHLENMFRRNAQKKKDDNDETDDNGGEDSVRKGFEVLAMSDDEESVSSASGGDTVSQLKPSPILKSPPAPEELEKEERLFAMSLLLFEVDDIRNTLRTRWRKWADSLKDNGEEEDVKELFAVTASTEYALSAIRKSVLQVSIEVEAFDDLDLDKIIAGIGESSSKQQLNPQELKQHALVTLQSLQKRSDLNGRFGFICSLVDGESDRVGVQLFPTDAYSSPDKKQSLSVKRENLLFSDDTHLRLFQIKLAFSAVDIGTMPILSTPEMTYGAPPSTSVKSVGLEAILQRDRINKAASNQDFEALLQLMIEYALPVWMSMSKYLPDVGAADAVLNAYIRDYTKTRKLKFPLAFALLVTMDSAIAGARAGREDTEQIFVNFMNGMYTSKVYTPAIRVLEKDGKKANALYSHFEIVRHLREEYSIGGMFFPLVTGELLLTGLRMHFVCGTALPYTYVEKYTNALHIYWMLRSEGFIGRIPELEAVVRIYRQSVFFRGGLATRGQDNYVTCQQLAHGVTAQAVRYLEGKALPPKTHIAPGALTREGLHVSEISQLLDALQWNSMPIVDKETCFNEIESIAREDFSKVFTAPILTVSSKLSALVDALSASVAPIAQQSGEHIMDNFGRHTARMTPIDLVSFWAMTLGNNWSGVPGEKEKSLRMLASFFARFFEGGIQPVVPDEKPTLAFSANDHKVDSSRVRRREHSLV